MDEKHWGFISTFQETKNRKVTTYPKVTQHAGGRLGLILMNSVSSQTAASLILREYS